MSLSLHFSVKKISSIAIPWHLNKKRKKQPAKDYRMLVEHEDNKFRVHLSVVGVRNVVGEIKSFSFQRGSPVRL